MLKSNVDTTIQLIKKTSIPAPSKAIGFHRTYLTEAECVCVAQQSGSAAYSGECDCATFDSVLSACREKITDECDGVCACE